jgi:hypothetical protein
LELIPLNASDEYLPNIKNVAILIPPFVFKIYRYKDKYASMRVIVQCSFMSFAIGAEDIGQLAFNLPHSHGESLRS